MKLVITAASTAVLIRRVWWTSSSPPQSVQILPAEPCQGICMTSVWQPMTRKTLDIREPG